MQQLGILLIVEKDAEMLVGSARRSSSGAAWGSTQTVKESRQGHRALLIGHVLECGALAAARRELVVAFPGREARRECRACRVQGAQR